MSCVCWNSNVVETAPQFSLNYLFLSPTRWRTLNPSFRLTFFTPFTRVLIFKLYTTFTNNARLVRAIARGDNSSLKISLLLFPVVYLPWFLVSLPHLFSFTFEIEVSLGFALFEWTNRFKLNISWIEVPLIFALICRQRDVIVYFI